MEETRNISANGFYKQKEVLALTGFCRTTLYTKEANGTFPRRRKLSVRRVGYLRSEIDAWIAAREAA